MKFEHLPLFAAAFDSALSEQETIAAIHYTIHNRAQIFRPKNYVQTDKAMTFDTRQTPLYGKNAFMPHVQLECNDGKVSLRFSLQTFTMAFILAFLAIMVLGFLVMLVCVAMLASAWLLLIPVVLALAACVLSLIGLCIASKSVLGVILKAADFKGSPAVKPYLPKK